VVKHLAKVREQALVLENLPTKATSPHLKFRCPIKFLHADELKTKKQPGEAQWLVNSSPASGKYAPLALTPGKTGRLPASSGGPVSFVVERPFETASDVMTGSITRLRHRLGCSQAPASRTANEEEIVI
jgi:hypothetical protein